MQMAKQILVQACTKSGLGTVNTWYAATVVTLLENTGKTDIRVDKLMLQLSGYSSCVAATTIGAVVHLSDENGNYLSSSVSDGSTNDAALTALLNQWKDNVFMTDFRVMGTGSDENFMSAINLEANTRRILKPGQKIGFSLLVQPMGAETSKAVTTMIDSILWYSAAAQ